MDLFRRGWGYAVSDLAVAVAVQLEELRAVPKEGSGGMTAVGLGALEVWRSGVARGSGSLRLRAAAVAGRSCSARPLQSEAPGGAGVCGRGRKVARRSARLGAGAHGSVEMVRTVLPVTVSIDGVGTRAETTVAALGATVVVISTALPALAEQHTTTYVGACGAPTTAVTLLQGPQGPRSCTRVLEDAVLPVTHARDRLLLDHAGEVQAALERCTGGVVAIDVAPAALEATRLAFPVAALWIRRRLSSQSMVA